MTSFGIKTESVGTVVDTRWRASAHGEDAAHPAQINVSNFTNTVGQVNPGYIPSGVPLALSGGELVMFQGSEGQELYGFINDDEGVPAEGTTQTISVLRHGGINPNYIVPAGLGAAVRDAADLGNFFLVGV